MSGQMGRQLSAMGGMGSMGGSMGGGMGTGSPTGADAKKAKPHYLTRTDFLIQFAWTPPDAGTAPVPDAAALEKIQQEVNESLKKLQGAINPAKIEADVTAGSKKLLEEKKQEELNPTKPATPRRRLAKALRATGPAAAPGPRIKSARAISAAGGRRRCQSLDWIEFFGRRSGWPATGSNSAGSPALRRGIDHREKDLFRTRTTHESPREARATMDQAKEYLRVAIKYRFWIIVGVSALLPIIGYAVVAGDMETKATTLTGAIKGADSGVKPFQNGVPAVPRWTELAKGKTEVLTDDVNKSWRMLYARQAPLLDWPKDVEAEFKSWGDGWPKDVDPNKIQLVIDAYVQVYPKYVEKVFNSFDPWDPGGGNGHRRRARRRKVLLRPGALHRQQSADPGQGARRPEAPLDPAHASRPGP